jgi:NADP-dependent 3-hydroxy acid dehydrogenase YdfG
MKVAVTGHSGALGKAIADRLARDGHQIVGFSLDNGYDISTVEGFRRIVSEALDCDIFVNCAYDRHQGTGQVNILVKLFHHWQNETKHIINIGSDAPDFYNREFVPYRSKYRAAKTALDAANLEINTMRKPCRVSIVRPGWINSLSATNAEKQTGVKLAKLEYEEVADIVAMIIDAGPTITISSITLARTIQHQERPNKLKKWLRRRW